METPASTPLSRSNRPSLVPALVGAASAVAADVLVWLLQPLLDKWDGSDEVSLALPALTLFLGILVLRRAGFAAEALAPLWPRGSRRIPALVLQAALIWATWRLAVYVATLIYDVQAGGQFLSMATAGFAAGAIGGAGMVLAVAGAARWRPVAATARTVAVGAAVGAVLLPVMLQKDLWPCVLTAPWQAAVLSALLVGVPRRPAD